MSKWLESGLRRDVCVVALAEGNPTQQSVKRVIERKNDERIRPKRFHSVVGKLEDTGIVERETDGVHDRISLTDAGEKRLREHREWVREQLE